MLGGTVEYIRFYGFPDCGIYNSEIVYCLQTKHKMDFQIVTNMGST